MLDYCGVYIGVRLAINGLGKQNASVVEFLSGVESLRHKLVVLSKNPIKVFKVFKLNFSLVNCALCCSCSSSSREGNWEITSMCFPLLRLFLCIFLKIWKVENSSYLCIVKFLNVGMGRNWHFDLVDVGEFSSQGGSREDQERRQSSTSEERLILQLNKAS